MRLHKRYLDQQLVLIVAFVTLLSGCVAGGGGRPLEELAQSDKVESYKVRAGDTLNVQVWGEQQLSGDVVVREDGKFTMQLAGDIDAVGQTLDLLSRDLAAKLETFVPGAQVAISLSQTAPIKYYLLGNFQRPGEQRSNGAISFLQAVATGGGFAPFANSDRISLIRKGSDGVEIRYVLSLDRVANGKEPNPQLRDGDVLRVE